MFWTCGQEHAREYLLVTGEIYGLQRSTMDEAYICADREKFTCSLTPSWDSEDAWCDP